MNGWCGVCKKEIGKENLRGKSKNAVVRWSAPERKKCPFDERNYFHYPNSSRVVKTTRNTQKHLKFSSTIII